MSSNHHDQQQQATPGSQSEPLQPPGRYVSARPDDIDEDMEQGTQSGAGSPRNAESAAPDSMANDRKRNEEND